MAAVRAHGHSTRQGKSSGGGGRPGVLGIRREDKNKWERRVPMTPRHVKELVKNGIKVIVQPSARRVFNDEEYVAAGAIVQDDLSECCTIAAVKEVPIDLLLPNRTWIFFSHTIKAQPAGMPLLDAALEKKVRLIDYECITETGKRGGPRLVAFGSFAGYAGAIDFLRGLGERFLALGYSTPLLHIGSAFMYPSLEEARRAVMLAGDAIRKYGLPKALCPFVGVFTGSGNVTKGALDIFQLLPHEMIDPGTLHTINEPGTASDADCRKLFLSVVTAEHMVRHKAGKPFDKNLYYNEPDHFEPIFQDAILPYSTVVVNCMYWDARFPRLFTKDDIHRHVMQGHDRLLGVCDITCDADGSVPTRQFTSIEQPFFVFNALTETVSECLDDPGVLFHAVDHLPSELPREASEHFGNCLLQFVPSLVASCAPDAPGQGDTQSLPLPMRGAVIAEGGALTDDYKYIEQLRNPNISDDGDARMQQEPTRVSAHGPQVSLAVANLEARGHLFDTMFINKAADLVEVQKGRMQITNVDVGAGTSEVSRASILVMATSQDILNRILDKIFAIAAEAKVSIRKLGEEAVERTLVPAKDARRILVLGSGFVCGPLIEYLLRQPQNIVTLGSIQRKDLEAYSKRFGDRCRPQYLDVLAEDDSMTALLDAAIQSSDLVVSLVPATMHVGIAKRAIQHQKHMVTASYVSPEMQSLDEEAKRAGVLIINEIGLDPGIDHLSAMKMIDDVTVVPGNRVLKFSSICGGLPAPEAAGSSPIGYKFSWSPKGVLLAARNAAKWNEDGKLKEVAGKDLLGHVSSLTVNNALVLDVLPNRDSTAFAELYGLSTAPTFFRGTFRYNGFCRRMHAIAKIGLLEPGPVQQLLPLKGKTVSRRAWLGALLGVPPENEVAALQKQMGADADVGVEFVRWLGLLSDSALPDAPVENPIDVLTGLLQREEMSYKPGERDMVVMVHELIVEKKDRSIEKHTATLIEYADPTGATAMARTVGITTAIAAQLVLDDPSTFGVGVQRPLTKNWYTPVLKLLDSEGIRLEERSELLPTGGSSKL